MPRVTVSLPDDLLARLDEEARRRGTSRSGLVREAVRRELRRRDFEVIDAAVARSRARFAATAPFDSAALIRRERDAGVRL